MSKPLAKICLVQFLRNPQVNSKNLTIKDWEILIRQARRTNLLSRVACLIDQHNLLQHIPEQFHYHLTGANFVASSNLRSVKWEIAKIYEALGAKTPFVLLKGAAYIMGESDAAKGRLFSDVDIMVQKKDLDVAEKKLVQHGWISTKIDAYDQRYYREWMHELPPMRNLKRQSELDVHHTIIPPTANLKPNIHKIWEMKEPVPDFPGMFVLSPTDMVLHSAAHLFHEGDFTQGLRDLVDLDILLREFSEKQEDFWQKLTNRADEMDLSRPLFYSLRYCKKLLGTPVPDIYYKRVSEIGAPPKFYRFSMDKMLLTSMNPTHIHNPPHKLSAIASFILFVRSHYLRMPLKLLIPHLVRKALKPD